MPKPRLFSYFSRRERRARRIEGGLTDGKRRAYSRRFRAIRGAPVFQVMIIGVTGVIRLLAVSRFSRPLSRDDSRARISARSLSFRDTTRRTRESKGEATRPISLLRGSFPSRSADPVGPTGALRTRPDPPLFPSSALDDHAAPRSAVDAGAAAARERVARRRRKSRRRRRISAEESAVWMYYRLTPPRQRRNELARYEGSKAPRQNNNRTQPPPPLSPATCVLQSWAVSAAVAVTRSARSSSLPLSLVCLSTALSEN